MARKYPGCAEQAQREIYRWMREGLSAGKHVVRLKIGDPFIFGRGGEEVLEMRQLGVEPKVVPGISSVFSAPLLGGVPVTHRGVATQVGVFWGGGVASCFCDYCTRYWGLNWSWAGGGYDSAAVSGGYVRSGLRCMCAFFCVVRFMYVRCGTERSGSDEGGVGRCRGGFGLVGFGWNGY